MKKLFIEPKQFEKKAYKPLEGNFLQWPSEIVKALYERYPSLVDYPYSLDFHVRNEKTNSAKGSIAIGPIEIPFIVDKSVLKPMLVFHPIGEPVTSSMPLSQSIIEQILSPKTFAKRLAPGIKSQTREYNLSGITQVKSASSSLLEQLNGTITEADKKSLINELITDDSVVASIQQNDTIDVLEKLSNLETKQENEKNEIIPDIWYIYKSAGLGWTMLTGDSVAYSPQKYHLNELDEDLPLIKTASYGPLIELIKHAEVTDTLSIDGTDFKKLKLENSNSYMLMQESGDYIQNFNKYAEMSFSPAEVNLPTATEVKVGDKVLLKTAKDSFIGPISVKSIFKDNGSANLHGTIGLTKVAVIENNKISKTITNDNYKTIYTPSLELIKLGAKCKNLKDSRTKVQKLKHTFAKRGNQYYVYGPEFQKLASLSGQTNPFNKNEALWSLVQLGATADTIEKAGSISRGEFKIEDKLKAPIFSANELIEKVASEHKLMQDYINKKFKGLVKEAASSIADKNTLDVILGLNLINEENLVILLKNIPLLNQTLNLLSQLWLMTCVGLNSVSPTVVEVAIERLVDIRDTLDKLSYVLKTK